MSPGDKAHLSRTIIVGNSGSGKTYLANKISRHSTQVFHLDEFFWEPGGFNSKRSPEIVTKELVDISGMDEWIVEGVFGELAELLIDRATCLIWLDMDWETCRKNLLKRRSESSKQLDTKTAENNFQALLAWASEYWNRTNSRSNSGHRRLFDNFAGLKYRLTSERKVSKFVDAVSPS